MGGVEGSAGCLARTQELEGGGDVLWDGESWGRKG